MAVKGTVNGVNVDKLSETIEAVKAMPVNAQFRFRVTNEWRGGGLNRSTAREFYGTSQEQSDRRKTFVLDADEPPLLLGRDKAANPVEHLLHALAACTTTSIVYHASARGVKIRSVEARIEGDIDLQGFLGIDENVRNGYQQIRMVYDIDADATPEELQDIFARGVARSPVFDTVTKGAPVKVELASKVVEAVT